MEFMKMIFICGNPEKDVVNKIQIFLWVMNFEAYQQIHAILKNSKQVIELYFGLIYIAGNVIFVCKVNNIFFEKLMEHNYIGFVCNGAFSENFVGKEFNCYHFQDTVSNIDFGCIDPLMLAYQAFHQSGIKLHDKVLEIGTGIICYFIDDLFRISGASFFAVFKINELKLHKAKELKLFYAYLDWK